jgi:DNA modification methylase/rubredoxin
MSSTSQPDLLREESGAYSITPEQQAEKDAYRQRLKAFLEDPASRQIEGFPFGENEAILALSDPPYYTACPNPFLAEIISKWQQERDQLNQQSSISNQKYHREPFAADVSEGKNDPIYNAHSYHTKVPHKAIMRYILHYTQPGDIVLDGFCGTGMTGVAAQLCGDKKTVESLGYKVDKNNQVMAEKGEVISILGNRKAVLVDLSPAATFIAHNYNTPVHLRQFDQEARRILQEVEKECGWMYETKHTDGKTQGKINFMIWSDVFNCPSCGWEVIFWDAAVDHDNGEICDEWKCPHCSALLSKSPHKESAALHAERTFETVFDRALDQTIRKAKQIPVLINYSIGKKRHEKRPDEQDLALLQKIENADIPYPFPIDPLPDGFNTQQPRESHGLSHVHHFYTRSNLWVLASLWKKVQFVRDARQRSALLLVLTAIMPYASKLRRFRADKKGGGPLSGTLYVASIITPPNVILSFNRNVDFLKKAFVVIQNFSEANGIGTSSSSAILGIPPNYLDYIFVDPPFGSNLMYSELNFIWEAWLGVLTNNQPEAIINTIQHKGISEYQTLMEGCFREFFRVLKPGRWMTVEFHNSANAIWNSIQEAVSRAGFVVADVRILDKQQGSFKQVTSTAAVKQDLIISAYKPNDNLEERFHLQAGSPNGAWDFVRYHLGQLPLPGEKNGQLEAVSERQDFLLFDRMVAFHIQRGASVPLSAGEFYAGLRQRFVQRDGMFFLPEQVPQYDAARLRLGQVAQLALFVKDEKSAIQWLRQSLDPSLGGEPKTRQDITPDFQRQLHQANYELLPELDVLLDQNFLQDENGLWYTPDHSKTSDLEKVRSKALLREFGTYLEGTGRLRQFRSEAVRAGFGECWKQREYATIIKVAERLPEAVLHEDPDLLMYYDNATLRVKS